MYALSVILLVALAIVFVGGGLRLLTHPPASWPRALSAWGATLALLLAGHLITGAPAQDSADQRVFDRVADLERAFHAEHGRYAVGEEFTTHLLPEVLADVRKRGWSYLQATRRSDGTIRVVAYRYHSSPMGQRPHEITQAVIRP